MKNVAVEAIRAAYGADVKISEIGAEGMKRRQLTGPHIDRQQLRQRHVWRVCATVPSPEWARLAPAVLKFYRRDALALLGDGGLTRKQRRRIRRAIRRGRVSKLKLAIESAR